MMRLFWGILALVSVVTLVFSSPILADNFYWTGASGGGSVWNASAGGTNWSSLPGNSSDPGSDPTSVSNVYFVFNGALSSTYSGTTLGTNFSINSLNFLSNASSPVGIGGAFTLTLGTGGITAASGGASQTISANVAVGTAAQTWTDNAATSTETIGGTFHAGDIVTTIVDGITVNYTVQSGDTNQSGVAIGIANAINTNASLVGLVNATTNGTIVNVSGFQGVPTMSASVSAGASTTASVSSGAALTISGGLSGSAPITLQGNGSTATPSGQFVFSGTNTYSGALTLLNANTSLTVGGNGTLPTATAVNLGGGSFFTIDDTGTNVSNRLPSTLPVNSNGGQINLLGSSSGSSTDQIGALSLNTGETLVNVTPGTGQTATLTINSLNRLAGAAVNFSSSGTIALTNNSLSNGILGRWATIGSLTNSGSLNFATISGGNVVAYSGYDTNTAHITTAGTGFATSNMQLNSGVSALSGNTTINTLYLTGTAGVQINAAGSNTQTLTIGAGGIIANGATASYSIASTQALVTNAAWIGGPGFSSQISTTVSNENQAGTIAVPSGVPDLVVTVPGTYNPVSGLINGALQLNVKNITNSTTALGSASASTATNSNVVTLSGTNTSNLYPGVAVTGLAGGGINSTTQYVVSIIDSTHFTIGNAATSGSSATATFVGNTGLTKNGGGMLDLADGNSANKGVSYTYAGPTTVNGGVLLFAADGNFGAGPLSFNPAAIVLNGGEIRSTAGVTLNSNRGITLGPQGGIISYTGGGTFTTASKITGSGGLTIDADSYNGGVTFNISNTVTDTYQGPTTIEAKASGATNSIVSVTTNNALPPGTALTLALAPNFQSGAGGATTAVTGFGTFSLTAGAGSLTIGSLASAVSVNGANVTGSTISVLTIGGLAASPVNQSAVYNGTITGGSLSLVKNGGGTQTFTAASTYARGTTINGGAIQVTNTTGSALGSGTVAINSGGILGGSGIVSGNVTVNNGGEIAPTLVGAGASTLQLGAGLTLNNGAMFGFNLGAINTGANPIAAPTSDNIFVTGALSISAGTDTINLTSVGSGLTVGTYHLITATNVPASFTGITFNVNGPLTDLYSVVDNTSNKSLDLVVTLNPNPFLKWVGGPGNGQWDLNAANKPWTLSPGASAFANSANITFDNTPGTSAAIVITANVAPGSLTFNNNAAVSYAFSGTGSITGDEGMTMQNNGSVTFSNTNSFTGAVNLQNGNLTVAPSGSLANASFLLSSVGSLTVNGALTAIPSISNSGTITFNNSNQTISSLSGPGLVIGNAGINFSNSGTTIQLNPLSSLLYTGTTNVFAGTTLQLASSTDLPNSMFVYNSANELSFLSGVGTFALGGLTGTTSFALQDTAAAGITLRIGANGQSSQFNGVLSGAGGISVVGGLFTLGTNNTYSGATTLTAGTLQLNNANSVVNSTVTANDSNGLAFSPSIGTFSIGGLAGNGSVTLNDTSNAAVALQVGGNGASTQFSGNLNGSGSLAKVGAASTLVFSGTNNYSGTTTVAAGSLQFAKPSALYNGNSSNWMPALVTVNSGATLGFNVGGPNDFSLAQFNALTTNLSTVNNNGFQAGATIAIDTSNSPSALTLGANVANSTGPGGGSLGFAKLGSGTLTLSGTGSSFTGGTSVANGQLILAGANSGTGSVVATNVASGGLTVISIRNSGALGSGASNSQLAPINLNATGGNLSTTILEIGATIGTDPGGNNADFSYQVVAPGSGGGTATPTNVVPGAGQINLGYLSNNNDGTGFAAYNANSLSSPRTVALYSPSTTTLAILQEKAQFGQGSGDHLTMGDPTANNTLNLLNSIDLNGGNNRRFDSIRGVGITPEGEYSGAIIDSTVTTNVLNISFDGNGGLIFNSAASTYGVATIQINGGAIYVAASDPAQSGTPGALGEGTATVQLGTSVNVNPGGGTSFSSSGANLAFMTYGPNAGVGSSPTTITARNIAVGGTSVVYANATLGGMTNDYTAMNGDISLNQVPTLPTTFTARNGGRVDFGGVISGIGSVVVGNSTVEGDGTAAGIAVGNNGTIVFNGANTYTGNTTVSVGKLYINGGNSTTTNNVSPISVSTGATLGGMGTINAPVTIAGGGFLEGGQSGTGALTLDGSLTFTGSASIVFGGLTSVGNPSMFIAGGLNTNSNTVSLDFTGAMSVGNFGLLNYPGVTTSTFTLPAILPNRAAGSLVVNGNELDLDITSLGSIVWTGATNTNWDTSTSNFVVQGGGATHYIDNPGDTVIFDDTAGTNTLVALNSGDVHPFSVTFNNNNATYTVSGSNAIAGTTGLSLTGTGTVILLNTNTYTGATSIGMGATLQLGNGTPGNDGSISDSLSIANNGTMVFNLAGSQSYGLPIGGSGSLVVENGLMALTATSTYGGTTTISGGTLQLGNGSVNHDGAITGSITDNGTLAFNYFSTETFTNSISGSGGILKTGIGTLFLTGGSNPLGSLTGPITLNQGIFQYSMGNVGTVVDLPNNIVFNGGTYYADGGEQHLATGPGATINVGSQGGSLIAEFVGEDLYLDGVLTGSGALNLSNSAAAGSTSVIHISNSANSYTGAVTANGTTNVQLSIDDNNAAALATVNVNGNASAGSTLIFGVNATAPKVGALSGNGSVSIQGITLSVGNNNTSTTYSGNISGAGSLTKIGSGVLALSGSSSFTGAATVSAGTLQLGVGGTTGQLPVSGTIVTNAALVFNRSNTVTQGIDFSSAGITGSGSVTQAGAGTLVLNAINTYSGHTNVVAGTLAIDDTGLNQGALPNSLVQVGSGGTLLARGNVGLAGGVTSSGTVSLVDNMTNTLSVSGGFNLNSSAFSFELGNSGALGTADGIMVSGAAALSGTNNINLSLIPGQLLVTGPATYTIISAASGLNAGGTFVLGTTPKSFDTYTLHNSSNAETLQITGAATPGTAYWTGLASRNISASDSANNWGYGTQLATPQSNWSTVSNGATDALQVPGTTTNVIFTAANATSNSGTLTTTLDGNYQVNSVTFGVPSATGITSTVLNTNGKVLTAGSGGLTVASATDPSTPNASSVTISGSGSVGLLTSQTWSNNNATQVLTVSSSINGISGNPVLTIGGSGAGGVILSGVIGDGTSSGLAVVINQAGVTQFTNANTFSAGLTLNSGTLSISNGNQLGAVPATLNPAAITFNGGVLQFTAGTTYGTMTVNPLRGVTLGNNGGTVNVNFPATGAFGTSENAVIWTTPFTGQGNLTVTGGSLTNTGVAGSTYYLELGASNSYAGSTTINNAVVSFDSSIGTANTPYNNALPATTVLNMSNNAWFVMCNGAANQTVAGLNGDATSMVGTTNQNNADIFTINPAAGQTYSYAGVIGAVNLLGKLGTAARVSLVIDGPGTQILTGSNTYTGTTTISQGTLQIGNGGTTGSIAAGSVITDNGTLVFDRADTITQGTDFNGAGITGGGSLVQAGSGTLVLNGTNGYSAGTTVLQGTLILNGASSLLAGSSLSIGNGAGPGPVFAPPSVRSTFPAAQAELAPVPEPGTFIMLGIAALAGFGIWRRKGMVSSVQF